VSDRRLLKSNGRVAHVSLEGEVEAERFTEGTWHQVTVTTAAILATPQGPRERELLTGDSFCVLDREDRFVFGFSGRDGYCGWLFADLLRDMRTPTHRVTAARSFRKATPDIKAWEPAIPLSYGARVEVVEEGPRWTTILVQDEPNAEGFREYAVPTAHLAPLDALAPDPVAEAAKLLGTPYVWGGNSSFGIDCSGLVQIAYEMCGIAIPADSDQQMTAGEAATDYRPGDLVFWKGHVAMVADGDRFIHANAGAMAVSYEGIEATIRRIEDQGEGPVTAHRRFMAG
jgi:cell wall-associated NlpC family hydrolase